MRIEPVIEGSYVKFIVKLSKWRRLRVWLALWFIKFASWIFPDEFTVNITRKYDFFEASLAEPYVPVAARDPEPRKSVLFSELNGEELKDGLRDMRKRQKPHSHE